jgi:hypothetical protein
LPARLQFSDPERITLAEIGKQLGRRALREVACVTKPDTILAWHRRLIAQKIVYALIVVPTALHRPDMWTKSLSFSRQ